MSLAVQDWHMRNVASQAASVDQSPMVVVPVPGMQAGRKRPAPRHPWVGLELRNAPAEARPPLRQVPGALVMEQFEGYYGNQASPSPPQSACAHPLVGLEGAGAAGGGSHAEQGDQGGERFVWLAHLINRFGHAGGFDMVAQVRGAGRTLCHGAACPWSACAAGRGFKFSPTCTGIDCGRMRSAAPAAHTLKVTSDSTSFAEIFARDN